MKFGIFALAIILPHSSLAADVYKCTDENGRKTFSDKPCLKTNTQETLKYKEMSLAEQLIAAVPGKSKVIHIAKDGDDTVIDYHFSSNNELQEFMRVSNRLSGKNVNLLKIIMPQGATMGQARLQITAKDDGFLSPKSRK